jgi:hypothetical protein
MSGDKIRNVRTNELVTSWMHPLQQQAMYYILEVVFVDYFLRNHANVKLQVLIVFEYGLDVEVNHIHCPKSCIWC